MRLWFALLFAMTVAGCSVPAPGPSPSPGPSSEPQSQPQAQPQPVAAGPRLSQQAAARNFAAVINRIEPVAEAECRRRRPNTNCDFKIIVDDRRGLPPNAFQTLDRSGRPIIGFTQSLIADARNADELAFILGHEAAHHIAGHIPRTQNNATTGAVLAGILTSLAGADAGVVREAQQVGAAVGARRYSKAFELEADALGTVIAKRAGFDPVLGSQFFNRIPDPGDQFLGTHPPNKERLATVRRVNSQL